MTIVNGMIAISKAAYDKAMEKVKSLIPRGTHIPLSQALQETNKWYKGWASYFKMTQFPAQLKAIEAHIRRRFRARIVYQQKRKRNLVKLLTTRGIDKTRAEKAIYSDKRTWNLSHTVELEKAFNIEWFIQQGQVIMSNLKLTHWAEIGKWVKLV
jgi:hypothetical protein